MIVHFQIVPSTAGPDLAGQRIAREASDLGLGGPWQIRASRGFVVEGEFTEAAARRVGEAVLVDPVIERLVLLRCDSTVTPAAAPASGSTAVHVLPKPGVTDPVGASALRMLQARGLAARDVRSVHSYEVEGPPEALRGLIKRCLANEAVEVAVVGPLAIESLEIGHEYRFQLITVPIRAMADAELERTSREGQLSLSLAEMKAVQAHFAGLDRDPTDCELETIAQTWSEHCSHKTLRGTVEFRGRTIDNLLKRTIFAATQELKLDWLVSVFEDNAGVVRFDDEHDVCFKVETHNHPSAIDPYGGSNTGLGGVIRDILGTGLGAKPIANTDVFCVAAPDTSADALPEGVLHPRRVLEGVIAGVRDYGNRMGIPTVNGAVVTHEGYLSNPLVFCGTIGVMPRGMSEKRVQPGDRIVALGGRTGRDGIHGATFSSAELTNESEDVSGGSVQIGNAITEKMVLDVLLQARDRGLFRSVTDCGAGGFSSAVGEMGAESGADVDLERAPLKYRGLSYTEIWISEAQERMVLAVPPEHWPELKALAESQWVEATDLGTFSGSGRLVLRYHGQQVCDLDVGFLHEGRPRVHRQATFPEPPTRPLTLPARDSLNADLLAVLAHWDVSSKEWIVRQYDHEVQARTVIKPLVGAHEDGPGNASVLLPVRGSLRGLAVSCGINPRYGDLDPYAMAACVIDEAVRNCVAVGADPDRIALLDNFCWGNPERPETLGSLLLAAEGCRDLAIAYGTPFISGKDSLYNDYRVGDRTLSIPPTLLISAMGQVPDVRRCVTMDTKESGNVLLLVGTTREEFGGSLWAEVHGLDGGVVPRPVASEAVPTFRALHQAISRGLVRACHDPSEGGLAVALAEMALAGDHGLDVQLPGEPLTGIAITALDPAADLFSESTTRFVIEVRPEHLDAVVALFRGTGTGSDPVPLTRIGTVSPAAPAGRLRVLTAGQAAPVIDLGLDQIRRAWKRLDLGHLA